MKRISLVLDTILRRWQVVAVTLGLGLVAVYFLFEHVPREFQASSHVLIMSESDGRDPTVTSLDLPAVATSTVVLSHVIDRLKVNLSVIQLQKAIKARVGARSSIMEISYRDSSADRAVAVPNAVADELSNYYDEISTQRADADVRRLDVTLDQTRRRFFEINNRLAAMTAQNTALGSEHAFEALSTRLDDLEAQRGIANATLQGDAAGVGALSPNAPAISKIAHHEILAGDEYFRTLVTGTSKDKAELAFDRAQYTDRLPGLRELQVKVAAENALVATQRERLLHDPDAFSAAQAQANIDSRKAQALVDGDKSRVAALDSLISGINAQLGTLPTASARYAWLRLQRDAAQADYLALSARRTSAEASRAEALSLGSVVVIDRAVRATTAVVGMGRSSLVAVTALFVLLIAFGMAFAAEYFDPRLRRADQIENLYGAEVIATLGKQ
jgi:capsular polysaccharide biosynthesis protein